MPNSFPDTACALHPVQQPLDFLFHLSRELGGRTFGFAIAGDRDRRTEDHGRPPSAADGGAVDAQDILFELVQRLGHPLDGRSLLHVVPWVAEQLHDQEQVVQIVLEGLASGIACR